jgi:hypothetical protein
MTQDKEKTQILPNAGFLNAVLLGTIQEYGYTWENINDKLMANIREQLPNSLFTDEDRLMQLSLQKTHFIREAPLSWELFASLCQILGLHATVSVTTIQEFKAKIEAENSYPQIYDTQINRIAMFPTRLRLSLIYSGIEYVGQLVRLTATNILTLKDIGHVSRINIEAYMQKNGLRYGTDVGDWTPPKS